MVSWMLAFCFMILSFFVVSKEQHIYIFILFLVCSIALLIAQVYWNLLLLILGMLIGYLWAWHYESVNNHSCIVKSEFEKNILVKGYLEDLPTQIARRVRFKLRVKTINNRHCAATILLNWYGKKPYLRADDLWQLQIKLKAPVTPRNFTEFDYSRWLLSQGIQAHGYVINDPTNQLLLRPPWYLSVNAARQRLSSFIRHAVSDRALAATLVASTIGSYHLLRENDWKILQNTGTTHLIAISGMNVSLVAGIFYFIFSWGWRRSEWLLKKIPAQKIAAIGALFAAWIYSLLAGMTVPTERALIMLAVVLLAELFHRRIPPTYRLLVALTLILAIWPLAAKSMSFWLSYFAVFILGMLFGARRQMAHGFREWLRIQIFIFIGLFPLTLLFFNKIALISIIANMVAIPYVSFVIVPLCLLASAMYFISDSVDFWLWFIAEKCFYPLWWYLTWLAHWPQMMWRHYLSNTGVILCIFVGTFLLLSARGFPARGVAWIFFLPLFLYQPVRLTPGMLMVTVFAVKKGVMVAVETQNRILIYLNRINYLDLKILSSWLQTKSVENIDVIGQPWKSTEWKINYNACQVSSWNEGPINLQTQIFNNKCLLKINSKYGSLLVLPELNSSSARHVLTLLSPIKILINASRLVATDYLDIETVVSTSGWLLTSRKGLYSTVSSGSIQLTISVDGKIQISKYFE